MYSARRLVSGFSKYYYAVYGCLGTTAGFVFHAVLFCDESNEATAVTACGRRRWVWCERDINVLHETVIHYSGNRHCHHQLFSTFAVAAGFTNDDDFVTVAMAILMLESAGLTYHYTNQAIQNQTYIKIDKSRSIPAIHFMAMGVYGTGGYSEKQAIQMAVLPTKAQKRLTQSRC